MTARAPLEAMVPRGGSMGSNRSVLKFVHRASASVATITLDDMGADTNNKNSVNPLAFVRGSEIELPSQVNLIYAAVAADFQPGMQYARRLIGLESNNLHRSIRPP